MSSSTWPLIHWLLPPLSGQPELLTKEAANTILTREEQEKFAALKTRERQKEWLLGRWTIKELLRRVNGLQTPLNQISTAYDDNGTPITAFAASDGQPFRISISHCRGHAFCAAISSKVGIIGADIEFTEKRAPDFAANFFTEREQEHLRSVQNRHYDMFLTAIWSAKEATLKALGSGWWRNTQLVSCLPNPELYPPGVWNRFLIRWHANDVASGPEMAGWWRVSNGFVLALASNTRAEPAQLGGT